MLRTTKVMVMWLTSTPTITADWEADSGQQWIVPFGGGVGKLVRFGKLPK